MPERPNSMHTLGLDINTHSMRGVQLILRKGKPFLESYWEIPIETIPSENGIKKETLEKYLVVTCLGSTEILVRPLEVKLKKESDIDAVLNFQAEPLLPYPVDNALVDRISIGKEGDGTQLTILAARKDHIQQNLEYWNSLKIEPEIISCTPIALAAFSQFFAPTANLQLVIHLGAQTITCALVKEGKLLAAQTCSQGIHQDHLQSDSLESLKQDITRTCYALAKQVKGQEIPTVLFCGEGGPIEELSSLISQTLNKQIVEPQIHPDFDLTVPQLQKFAIPLGAALTALPNGSDQINFRQLEFAYPNPWKRYKIPLGIYAGLCVALAISILFMGHSYIKYREDSVRKSYAELLEFMHKPYNDFEREFLQKNPSKPLSGEAVFKIKELAQQDLNDRLRHLEKELQSTPDIYPLLPNIPNVSDVFAWLSTHPKVVFKDPKTGEKKPLLQVETFSYSIVKRPEMTKKQEKYQAKVEIEFSSPTPKLAREFHDALIAPNTFIDPKGEVKWNTNRGLYKATFYLKDKTLYPSS